ncbi:hypothetical protein DOTSEDRAFT_69647 [Dothistroma septosporum NZE10]|uniref:Mitochondrial inner membrane protease subunit n=1 Tax=Dothistroma septosporum (strain NZE10 / CBS 128990) TaxID=675120 RepID=N1PWJ2_DOTSN|nr:hypothetical protein DOTSEDRAFT_69647 [Dothistroma septosporum NZE10]
MPFQGTGWAYWRGAVWGVLIPMALPLTSLILLKDHVVEVTSITGASMAPTLSPDFEASKAYDYVLWKMWKPTRDLQRGDVVHFSQPHKPDGTAVKRVIALGGDTVVLDPKRRPKEVLNGRLDPAAKSWDMRHGKVVVPEGHVWVEGDNIGKTVDSNVYGPVSESLILGKATMLIWPMSQFTQKPWEGYKSKTMIAKGLFERRVNRSKTGEDELQAMWEPGR